MKPKFVPISTEFLYPINSINPLNGINCGSPAYWIPSISPYEDILRLQAEFDSIYNKKIKCPKMDEEHDVIYDVI